MEDLIAWAKMAVGSVSGTDGWNAELLFLLPLDAWERLAEILRAIEKRGVWPDICVNWRVACIPKAGKDGVPQPDSLRPIAIGQVIYRMWASIRAKSVASSLSRQFGAKQAGGKGTLDAETMVLDFFLNQDIDGHDFAASLDFDKFFDTVDPALACKALEQMGVPNALVRLISDAWHRQIRWVSFGGAIDPRPITGIKAIPQGDPWSMWAVAALLKPVLVKLQQGHPMVLSWQFADDRTMRARTLDDLISAMQ